MYMLHNIYINLCSSTYMYIHVHDSMKRSEHVHTCLYHVQTRMYRFAQSCPGGQGSRYFQPVPKAYRKWCVKFQMTPSVRTGFPAVIKHSLSQHLKCLKSKTWNDLTSANLFFLGRRMRSAAKRVEQLSGYGYLSKMEWFSLRPQHV